jgi:hypothetical protein
LLTHKEVQELAAEAAKPNVIAQQIASELRRGAYIYGYICPTDDDSLRVAPEGGFIFTEQKVFQVVGEFTVASLVLRGEDDNEFAYLIPREYIGTSFTVLMSPKAMIRHIVDQLLYGKVTEFK